MQNGREDARQAKRVKHARAPEAAAASSSAPPAAAAAAPAAFLPEWLEQHVRRAASGPVTLDLDVRSEALSDSEQQLQVQQAIRQSAVSRRYGAIDCVALGCEPWQQWNSKRALFKALKQNTTVRQLTFTNCTGNADCVAQLNALLASNPRIRSLSFELVQFDHAKSLRIPAHLEVLIIHGSDFCTEPISLQWALQLRTLSWQSSTIDSGELSALAHLLRNSSALRKLDLEETVCQGQECQPADMKKLGKAIKANTSLMKFEPPSDMADAWLAKARAYIERNQLIAASAPRKRKSTND